MNKTRIVGCAFAGLVALAATDAAAWDSAPGQTPQEKRQSEAPAPATTASGPQLHWITLGTQGGPSIYGVRSEPANLLVVDGKPWIVDCGDGAMERLAAAGFSPDQVTTA